VKAVVTGAAGFIGSNYVRTLCAGGFPAWAGADVAVHFAAENHVGWYTERRDWREPLKATLPAAR